MKNRYRIRGSFGGPARQGPRSGVAAVEFAIILPFLIAATMALVDYGAGVYWRTQLDAASRTGAQFAMDDDGNTTAIAVAVKAAIDLPAADVTVTTTEFCECVFGTVTPCTSTCGADEPRHFLRVEANYTLDTILISPFSVTGETVIRVE